MNVAELKDRIFKGTSHKYQDTFHMLDLLNEALNLMTNDAQLETVSIISVMDGTSEYALPDDYKSYRALVEGTIDNPCSLYPLVPIDETAIGYAIWNGEIVIKPTPNESKKLNFYYYKWANELSADIDVPEIDPHYHSALASYAIAMILSLPEIEGDKHMVDRHFAIFNEARMNFKMDASKGKRLNSVRLVEGWR